MAKRCTRGPARVVVALLMQKGGRGDVIKLVSAYETALYGIPHMRTNNGYEQRRRGGFGGADFDQIEGSRGGFGDRAGADQAGPGESTDGAVFFGGEGKGLRSRAA